MKINLKIHCDRCNKFLGKYFFGKGGVAEKAKIRFYYTFVPIFNDKNSNVIGLKKIPGLQFPDVKCFECYKEESKLKLYSKEDF